MSSSTDPILEHEQPRYEADTARWLPLAVAVAGMLATIVTILVTLHVFQSRIDARPRPEDLRLSSVDTTIRFDGPRLQPSVEHDRTPPQDLTEMHRDEDQVLTRLGLLAADGTQRVPDEIVEQLTARRHAGGHP